MARTPHTSTRKGKRVLVLLRDGQRIDDIFEDAKGRFVILRQYGKLSKDQIRAFIIKKAPDNKRTL